MTHKTTIPIRKQISDRRVMPVKPAEPQTTKVITEFDNFHIPVL